MIPNYIQGVERFPPVRKDWKKYFNVPTTRPYLVLFKMNNKRHMTKAICKFYYGTKSPFADQGAEWQVLDECGRIKMCISPHQVEAWFYSKEREKRYGNNR